MEIIIKLKRHNKTKDKFFTRLLHVHEHKKILTKIGKVECWKKRSLSFLGVPNVINVTFSSCQNKKRFNFQYCHANCKVKKTMPVHVLLLQSLRAVPNLVQPFRGQNQRDSVIYFLFFSCFGGLALKRQVSGSFMISDLDRPRSNNISERHLLKKKFTFFTDKGELVGH